MTGVEAAAVSAVASGILKLVGNKLAPLLIKEYSSTVGVKKDLEELQGLVEQISPYLETKCIAAGNDSSLEWLKKLKDVAYDVDDVVDKFKLKAEKHEADGVVMGKCIQKKADSLIFKCKAARKIKAIKKRFSAIVKQETDVSVIVNALHGGHPDHRMNQTTEVMPSLPIVNAPSIIGRDEDKSKIISKLKEANKGQQKMEIVSVIGLGGSGKTSLAKLVFNDRNNIEKHFEVRLWIHVSREFHVQVLVKKLFEEIIRVGSKEEITRGGSKDLPLNCMSETISKKLSGKRFLLVLDDVWIEDFIQWHKLQEEFMVHLNSGAPTSKILLTTRSKRVAQVVKSTDLFHLPLLSPDDSWQLFTRSATVPSKFEEVGKEIVKKCGGVPLAIISLACVLRNKGRIEQWQAIRDTSSLDVEDAENVIFACLRLSYIHMPSHVKPCFTICSLSPKGFAIDKEQLIDQWIAHDMVAVVDTAEDYFDSLVQMSFLQDVEKSYDGRVKCRMHDLVHDLGRSILDNEISLGATKKTTYSRKSYRYFSLGEEPIDLLPENPFEKARAVHVYKFCHTRFGKAWKNAEHLRSITMMISCTESVLTDILQTKNLRYLALRGLKCEALPEAISDIWSLQSLHLTFSNLVQLPKSIGKLQKLRRLNLSCNNSLQCLPDSIGDCQMISSIDLYGCLIITVLPNCIGRNEKLIVLRLGSTRIERLPSSITTLGNLECLDLQCCEKLVELPEGIGNMEKLKVLNLKGCKQLVELPEGIGNMKELKVLNLKGCNQLVELPEGIDNMKELQVLNLKGCDKLGGMPVGFGQLSGLQELGLFVVGEGEKFAGISELANIPRIGEGLSIKFKSHGMDPDDAYKACLKQKTNLQRLDLEWMAHGASEVNTESEQAVLDRLEPPPGIKELKIVWYFGRQYARWIQNQVGGGVQGHAHFPFLRVMKLCDFRNLKHLCDLAELPCLEELELRGMHSLESISGGPFPSLVKLCLSSLYSLGELWMVAERTMPDGEEGGGCSNCTPNLGYVQVGSCLSYMDISGCPELKVKSNLPLSLQELRLQSTNEQVLQWPCECKGFSSFANFSHLKKLVLNRCTRYGRGWDWELLQHMTALESLEISAELTELPECLRSLTSLRYLVIWSCSDIRVLPQALGELRSLQALIINGCEGLISLPESLGGLRSLRILRIYNCKGLISLPESMCGLISLEELCVQECRGIKSLPEEMEGLTALKRLKIYGCESLRSFPQSMGHVTSLQSLEVECSGIRMLPESLGELRSLQELTIQSCRSLISLPESLGKLHSLRKLHITRLDGLTCLPRSMCGLTSLEKLYIDDCVGLASLPEGIKGLASLKELCIIDCRGIKSLPQGIKGLTALQILGISGCPDLARRCERGKGKDWHLISHVPGADFNKWCTWPIRGWI